MLLLQKVGFEWDNKMPVSSANKIGTDISLTNVATSVIKMRKSKGPITEPWGAPCLTSARDDVVTSFSLHSNVL
jgi:hypothetical protein